MSISLPMMAMAATAVGGAVSAFGAIQQGQAAQAQAEYQAKIMENNRIIAEQEAEQALERGRVEEENVRRRVAQLRGRQRAQFASMGQLVDTGSAADIGAETEQLGEVDALTTRYNAEREAMALRARGQNFQSQAGLMRQQGRNSQIAGLFGAGSTILSTAGTIGTQMHRMNTRNS